MDLQRLFTPWSDYSFPVKHSATPATGAVGQLYVGIFPTSPSLIISGYGTNDSRTDGFSFIANANNEFMVVSAIPTYPEVITVTGQDPISGLASTVHAKLDPIYLGGSNKAGVRLVANFGGNGNQTITTAEGNTIIIEDDSSANNYPNVEVIPGASLGSRLQADIKTDAYVQTLQGGLTKISDGTGGTVYNLYYDGAISGFAYTDGGGTTPDSSIQIGGETLAEEVYNVSSGLIEVYFDDTEADASDRLWHRNSNYDDIYVLGQFGDVRYIKVGYDAGGTKGTPAYIHTALAGFGVEMRANNSGGVDSSIATCDDRLPYYTRLAS